MKEMISSYAHVEGVSFHSIGSASYNDAYREVSENDIAQMIPINFFLMFIFSPHTLYILS